MKPKANQTHAPQIEATTQDGGVLTAYTEV